jgi:hypothetical protein
MNSHRLIYHTAMRTSNTHTRNWILVRILVRQLDLQSVRQGMLILR